MRIIAHRGNTAGIFESYENEPNYIDLAIKKGFDAEIDVWYKDGVLWLGHDKPDYGIDLKWIKSRITRLWIHCKNLDSLLYFKEYVQDANYFWHQTDDVVLTSKCFFWTYPGKPLCRNSIAVLLDENYDYSAAFGVCTDYAEKIK